MVAPFLKWAGGKRFLLPEIIKRLPKKINTYYEPMVGGGAVFFHLAEAQLFNKAKISDMNEELIKTYISIRDDVDNVIDGLNWCKDRHNESFYYKMRSIDTSKLDHARIAIRMIYLNRTCFNGLYRVNRSGFFNVPFGQYKNPTICNEKLLREVHKYLQDVDITCQDFEQAVEKIRARDFAYFDPPYWPVNKGSFTAYTDRGFDSDDHERLAILAHKLKQNGCFGLFSNADVPAICKLYKGLLIKKVNVPRRINSDGKSRGVVSEILISTKERK
jgi:DNA adenine methylase